MNASPAPEDDAARRAVRSRRHLDLARHADAVFGRLCASAPRAPDAPLAAGARARRICARAAAIAAVLKSRRDPRGDGRRLPRRDRRVGGAFVRTLGPRRVFRPAALAALEAHRAAGDHLVLLSASPDLYVPLIGRLLGFERTLCTELRWRGDRLDGALRTPNRRGEEKLRCLEALRPQYPGRRHRRLRQQRLGSGSLAPSRSRGPGERQFGRAARRGQGRYRRSPIGLKSDGGRQQLAGFRRSTRQALTSTNGVHRATR